MKVVNTRIWRCCLRATMIHTSLRWFFAFYLVLFGGYFCKWICNLDRVLLLWVWNLRDIITMFIYPLVVSCIRRASWAGGAAKSLDGSGSCSPTPTAETWWVAKIRRILIDAWNIFIPLLCYLYSYFVYLPSSHFHAGRLPRPQFVVRIRGALLWRLD